VADCQNMLQGTGCMAYYFVMMLWCDVFLRMCIMLGTTPHT
jgi:hypothetical protein